MRWLFLLPACGLAGCAPPVAQAAVDFERVTAGRMAGPAQGCIATNSNDTLRAVDSMTLVYGSGSTIYINRLGAICPGLQDLSTIAIDGSNGNYCRGDRIRPLAPGSVIAGPTCNLGQWVPYRSR
ncbi:MAG: hypothetical protein ABIS38_06555 [Sphingomicrobium sp.]